MTNDHEFLAAQDVGASFVNSQLVAALAALDTGQAVFPDELALELQRALCRGDGLEDPERLKPFMAQGALRALFHLAIPGARELSRAQVEAAMAARSNGSCH